MMPKIIMGTLSALFFRARASANVPAVCIASHRLLPIIAAASAAKSSLISFGRKLSSSFLYIIL